MRLGREVTVPEGSTSTKPYSVFMDVYAAFVKVMRWDASVIDLLSRMPQVEKKVDRRIKLSSMLQYSNFVGLWFRSPANLHNLATTVH